ncbi:MAG: fibrobacter succinogenes major paralogous domain-containing protein [Bacteroidales bacterium]|nr:fibrobacter succinogenes major paralogous domain-containing protein [Bacteroidales bacterium]
MKKIKMNLIKAMTLVFVMGCAMSLSAQKDGGTVKDVDGNEYKTVVIGSQTWFAENLKTTKYANGNKIPNITDNAKWVDCKSPAYCWYDNNSGNKEWGALYNWYVINSGNICPNGWHVATDADWTTLENKVGGRSKAALALRESGKDHWKAEPETGKAKDDYGFGMYAAGFRNAYGDFTWQTVDAGYWTATGKTPSYAWNRTAYYYDEHMNRHEIQKCFGYSVRCVKN